MIDCVINCNPRKDYDFEMDIYGAAEDFRIRKKLIWYFSWRHLEVSYRTKPNNTKPKLQYLVNSVRSTTAFSKRYSQSFNTSLLFYIRQMSCIEWPRKGSYYGMVKCELLRAIKLLYNVWKHSKSLWVRKRLHIHKYSQYNICKCNRSSAVGSILLKFVRLSRGR